MTQTIEIKELRRELWDLNKGFCTGDVPEKKFNKEFDRLVLDIYRATVDAHLEPDEKVEHEHHAIRAHLKFNQSILKETDQQAVSLFLTDRRLVRLRSIVTLKKPVTCDERDSTVVDAVALDSITGVPLVRQVRYGEMITGAIIAIAAMLLRPLLQITFIFMFLLGVGGVIHGLILPTKWYDVSVSGAAPEPKFRIHAVRKKSAKKLVALLRRRIADRQD